MKFDPIRLDIASYPFTMTVAPRFADMDILKHINNLSLAEYHEEARTRDQSMSSLRGSSIILRHSADPSEPPVRAS